MVDEVIGVALRGKDESLGRTLKAGRKELMATERAINSTSAAFDENTKAQERISTVLRQTKQSFIGAHRSIALMPASVQALNGTMIELAITLGSISAIASPFVLLTKQTIEYNSTLERNRLGIASVITAVGQLHDADGKLLTGREALNAALVMASDLQKKLQSDALTTAATFSELSDAFQIAIGPGLQAGLSLPEIEKVSVGIAQAAAAIGVPMNQLAEEVRSLLSGTITQKNTRIATVLGIDNKDIAQAKQNVGGLAAFIQEKFRAFGEAGQVASTQWDAMWANTLAAAQRAIGEGMTPLFDALKGDLKSVFDALIEVEKNAEGKIMSTKVRPEVLESFKALGEDIHTTIELLKLLGGAAKTAVDTVGLGGLAIALFSLRGLFKKNADGVRAFSGVIADANKATGGWVRTVNSAGGERFDWDKNLRETSKGVAILTGTVKTLMRALWPILALEGALWLYDFFKEGADGASEFEKSLRSARDAQDDFLSGYQKVRDINANKTSTLGDIGHQKVGDFTADRTSTLGDTGYYERISSGGIKGLKDALTPGEASKQAAAEILKRLKPKSGNNASDVTLSPPENKDDAEAASNAKRLRLARNYLDERAKLSKTAWADELTKNLSAIDARKKQEKQAVEDNLQVLRDQKVSEEEIKKASSAALLGIEAQYQADRKDAYQADAKRRAAIIERDDAEAASKAKKLKSARSYLDERAKLSKTAWADELTKNLSAIDDRKEQEKQALEDNLQLLRDQKVSEEEIKKASSDALLGIEAQYQADRAAAYKADEKRQKADSDRDNQRKLEKQKAFYELLLSLQSEFSALFAGNARINQKKMNDDIIKFAKSAKDIDKKTWDGKLKLASATLGALSSMMESRSRRMFEVGKAAAISQAVIDGYRGATKALGDPSLSAIEGIVVAGVIAASAAANVANIASTQFGGGGGSITAGAAGGGGFSAAPSAPTSIIPEAAKAQGAQINVTLNALDPSSVTDQVLRGIGERLAPVIQDNFDRNTQMQVTA